MSRQPSIIVAIGMTGVGKTYKSMQILRDYVRNIPRKQKGRPVLIIDLKNEYQKENIYAIAYNPEENSISKRTAGIRAILGHNKIFRILAKYPNGVDFNRDQIFTLIQDIKTYFRNGMVLLEDMAGIFPKRDIPEPFIDLITSMRHVGLDLMMHIQSFNLLQAKLIHGLKYIRLHKTTGSIKSLSSKKFTEYTELLLLAEMLVNDKYNKAPYRKPTEDLKGADLINRTYFVYVDTVYMKIFDTQNRTQPDPLYNRFLKVADQYLQKHPKLYTDWMGLEDDNGKRKFRTKKEAREAYANKLANTYLL